MKDKIKKLLTKDYEFKVKVSTELIEPTKGDNYTGKYMIDKFYTVLAHRPLRKDVPVLEGVELLPEWTIEELLTTVAVGTQNQHDTIRRHMDSYFMRYPSYKEKFTTLEWYHIFLDFYEKII